MGYPRLNSVMHPFLKDFITIQTLKHVHAMNHILIVSTQSNHILLPYFYNFKIFLLAANFSKLIILPMDENE